jgi:hypothetical protein
LNHHEDPDVVADQASYILKCFKVEMRKHVWVQLPLQTYTKTNGVQATKEMKLKQRKQT